jgi:uncharacterized protein DUF1016
MTRKKATRTPAKVRKAKKPRRGVKPRTSEFLPVPARSRTAAPAGYADLLQDLKSRIRSAQVKAALAVNQELIALYWQIGRKIIERQRPSSTAWAAICRPPFRAFRASRPAISGACEPFT